MKRSRRVMLSLLATSVLGCSGPIGENFRDADEIGMSETWADWVIVGRFGASGPFRVTDVKTCDVSEPCSFSHQGQVHTYDKFTGFKLTILRLETRSGETAHVVLRSRQKFGTNPG